MWKILFFLYFAHGDGHGDGHGCNLYLAPSKLINNSRGIFAGKSYEKNQPIDYVPSILLNSDHIRGKQISNYVFSSNHKRFTLALFGTGMFYNHKIPSNVAHYYSDDPPGSTRIIPSTYSKPYTTYPDLVFVAESDIAPYEELFVSYGDASWFLERKIPISEPIGDAPYSSSSEELEKFGYCLTNVYINQSTIPLAGKGLFANRSYVKGDIVTISPILFLSKDMVQKLSDTSAILNYCICSEISDVCILPIGHGVMINHGGKFANVDIQWYDWGSKDSPDRLSWSVENLENFQAAPLDIAYRASRDIEAGEEIFLSYGRNWEMQWLQYLQDLQEWNQKYVAPLVGDFIKPQFRAHLLPPNNLFPPSWDHSHCLAQKGCNTHKKLSKRKIQSEMKHISAAKEYIQTYFQEVPTKE